MLRLSELMHLLVCQIITRLSVFDVLLYIYLFEWNKVL